MPDRGGEDSRALSRLLPANGIFATIGAPVYSRALSDELCMGDGT